MPNQFTQKYFYANSFNEKNYKALNKFFYWSYFRLWVRNLLLLSIVDLMSSDLREPPLNLSLAGSKRSVISFLPLCKDSLCFVIYYYYLHYMMDIIGYQSIVYYCKRVGQMYLIGVLSSSLWRVGRSEWLEFKLLQICT